MERKIGEIFEYKGDWYQCLELKGCIGCAFYNFACADIRNVIGKCVSGSRSDTTSVLFKKLEKVGEPYEHHGKLYQCYKLPMETEIKLLPNNCNPIGKDNLVEIEIKQKEDMGKYKRNKEDIEEKKVQHDCSFDKETSKSNLKPFDLEAAKVGKPVCTRDGRKARIICFDRKDVRPIIALIESDNGDDEGVYYYYADGLNLDSYPSVFDLMMLPEKKEGYINIYRSNKTLRTTGYYIFDNKEEAIEAKTDNYITTIKVEWEE